MSDFLSRIAPIWRPHIGQEEFLRCSNPIRVLACGRRWGKTDACAVEILASLFEDSPTRHLILAPTQDQATILFDRLIQLLERLYEHEGQAIDWKVKQSPYPALKFGPHRVTARSGHIPRTLRGQEATHIVVDEAAYLPESLITEVAMPMLATTRGKLILISTPHGKDYFWRFFRMGMEGRNGIWSRHAPSSENPLVDPDFLSVQRELISARAFRIEYEASFEDSEGRVFKTEAVEAALVPKLDKLKGGEAISIGIDFGKYRDFTTITVLSGNRHGAQVEEMHRFNKMNWLEAIQRIQDLAARYPNARIKCDATGGGDPIVDFLNERLKTRIDGVVFTSEIKAQLVDNLRWMFDFQTIKMLPNLDLLRELEHFEATPTDAGHTKFESRIGHDDMVIALALAASNLRTPYVTLVATAGRRNFATIC